MSAELGRLVRGFQATQAVHVAAVLRIADLLADGGRTSDELAGETSCDPSSLYRLLRALASLGVLEESDGRTFSLTALGEPLRSDVPGSLHGWAAFVGRDHVWRSWGNLADAVRTGENSFRSLHGTDVWEWRAERPEESAAFDRAMTSLTSASNAAIVEAYDFGQFRTIVDVAGGTGVLLAAILSAHPTVHGILFDQPHVVAGAEPVLTAAGVRERCTVVSGSFFTAVPEGGDAYVLKSIVHDWEDEEAIAILRACEAAMRADARVLVIERDLGLPNESAPAKLSDLNMLVMVGGRERTRDEYELLLGQAGLRLARVDSTRSGHAIIEAVKAAT